MSFSDPTKVWQVIQNMIEAGRPRSLNRARINSVFNGDPPWTPQEATDNLKVVNVNFLEGTRVIKEATRQATNGLTKPSNYFAIKLDTGPRYKRNEWGKILTKNMNKPMKRSSKYSWVRKNQIASSILHGIGPCTWMRERDWCPTTRGIEDMKVPSNTLVSCENLSEFAMFTTFTAAQLIEMTRGETVDPCWNKPLVDAILKELYQRIGQSSNYLNYSDFPEKVEEDFKENSGYYGSDQVPTIRTYDFYYLDTKTKDKPFWKRKIVLDKFNEALSGLPKGNDFLFDGKDRNYGDLIDRIMHVQFADGAVVPPFRWHSVRSLGYLLYALCHLQNRLRCDFIGAVFESMLWYFHNVAEGDKERLGRVQLSHMGIIPQGLTFVPANERHTIDYTLLNGAMAMHRQLMAESSASYTQDIDNGTRKEQTATEVMAKVNSANALVGSMLNDMYDQSTAQYREIGRRFCTLDHEDCKAFREKCMAEGVDEGVFKNFEDWEFVPERVLGQGNKMLEIAQADRLMAARSLHDPDAQRQILHMYDEANTDDPLLADSLVPIAAQQASTAVEKATLSWGTLVDGMPVVITDGINRIEYIDTLLEMLNVALGKIEQAGGMSTPERVAGLANVMTTIGQQVEIVAQDEEQGERVKSWKDALGKASNLLKGYAQRLQEEAQAQQEQGGDGQMQADIIAAQTKGKISEELAAQKMLHKDEAFKAEQQRKNVALEGEIARQDAHATADIAEQDIKARAELLRPKPIPTA